MIFCRTVAARDLKYLTDDRNRNTKNAGNKILKFFAKFCAIEAKLVKIT